MSALSTDEIRELTHIRYITATATGSAIVSWTFRTPRSLVTPLVRAGYVIEHPIQKDFYQVTAAGIAALATKSEDVR